MFAGVVGSARALQIGHTYAPSRVVVGGKLTYTYNLQNDGTADESGTLFTNRLPVNTVFVSAAVTNGTFQVSNHVFSFRPEKLPAGESTIVQLVVTPVGGLLATNLAWWVGSKGDVAFAHSTAPVSPAMAGPKMLVGRQEHTSTLLQDGRVLVVGGLAIDEPYLSRTTTAEVYSPQDEAFSLTGSMTAGRASHTATRLDNGKVLVACGTRQTWDPANSTNSLETAEVFDPASNTFIVAASLEVHRAQHTATLLPNGDLILAGGNRTNTLIERLYAQGTTWVAARAGNLLVPRTSHIAALLPDGKILFAGGTFRYGTDDTNQFAEIFDPESGISQRVDQGAALPVVAASRGRVLLHAEQNVANEGTAVYDIETNQFRDLAPRPLRYAGSRYLTLDNGDVLETGGYWTAAVNIFDLRAATWRSGPALNIVRASHSAVQLADGRVLLTGGGDLDGIMGGDMRSTELYALRLDSDRDGMEDLWEIAHGFDPARREDAVEDADGEGHTNFQEYLAGTDPRDPENVLKIDPPEMLNNQMRIRFRTVIGKYYRVEKSGGSDDGKWLVVAASIPGDGRLMEISEPAEPGTTRRLYRVVLLP